MRNHQHAVVGGLDDAPVVLGDLPVEELIHEDALPLGETGHSWPEVSSSGSIGSRGCQGPLDVGSGSGQALRSGLVLRSFLRCVCTASEEVRGAIGLALGHGVDLRSTGRSLTGRANPATVALSSYGDRTPRA